MIDVRLRADISRPFDQSLKLPNARRVDARKTKDHRPERRQHINARYVRNNVLHQAERLRIRDAHVFGDEIAIANAL